MKSTLKDIAQECGVSIYTVSAALHDKTDISPATKQKVREAARRLRYSLLRGMPQPEAAATKTIGLVLPKMVLDYDPFFSRAIFSTKQSTSRREYGCAIYSNEELVKKVADGYAQGPQCLSCDGFLYFCPQADWEPTLQTLKDWNVPCVVVKRETMVKGVPVIVDDDYRGAQLALEHLRGLGRTRIAFTGRWLDRIIAGRTKAYREFLEKNKLPSDKQWVFDLELKPLEELHRWLDRLMALPGRPTALVCTSDEIALWCIRHLNDRGHSVPADLAVTGYDNDALAAQFRPSITTVNIPIKEMVEIGCKVLIDLLHEEEPGALKMRTADIRIEVQNELVVRESTGPARA